LNFDELPTVKKVALRIKHEDHATTYQSVRLTRYEDGMAFVEQHKNEMMESVLSCLKNRIRSHHPELLTNTLTILATQGWNKSNEVDFSTTKIDELVQQFLVPLQEAGVNTAQIIEEWEDMLDYARRYLNITEEENQIIWFKLFNCPDSKKWTNILALVELLFCLPMANGRVERAFSAMNVVKTDRRNCLGEDHLDDLMRITFDGPQLAQWDASGAIDLWWKDKLRRQVSDIRSTPRTSHSSTVEDIDDSSDGEFNLEDWESFVYS